MSTESITRFYKIILETPLVLGQFKGGSDYLDTKIILPGTILRGALAAFLLKSGRKSDIQSIIEQITFQYFYPVTSKDVITYPQPLTSLNCKLHAHHPVIDTLLFLAAYKLYQQEYQVRFIIPPTLECRTCLKEAIDNYILNKNQTPKSGPFPLVTGKTRGIEQYQLHTQTRTAINRSSSSADHGLLYTTLGISPGLVYAGEIRAPEKSHRLIEKAIQIMGIGARTTKGYGQVSIELLNSAPAHAEPDFATRMSKFNTKFQAVWQELRPLVEIQSIAPGLNLPDTPPKRLLALSALSPCLLTDAMMLPTHQLALEQIFDDTASHWRFLFSMVRPDLIGGWSGAWGLPKFSKLGTQAGSTWCFYADQDLDLDSSLRTIELLEQSGIGQQTDVGFGQILTNASILLRT